MKNLKLRKSSKLTAILALAVASILCLIGGLTVSFNKVQADVEPSFTMVEGLQVRTNAPEGLRFIAKVKTTDKSATAAYGIVMQPDLEGNENLEVNADGTAADSKSLVIPATKWYTDQMETDVLGAVDSVYDVFTGVLIADKDDPTATFPESLYNQPLIARGYMIDNGTVTYTDNTVSRSIGYVAFMASLENNYDAGISTVNEKFAASARANATLVLSGADQNLGYSEKCTPTLKIGGVEVTAGNGISITYTSKSEDLAKVENGQLKGYAAADDNATINVKVELDGGLSWDKDFTVACKAPTVAWSLDQYSIVNIGDEVDLNDVIDSDGHTATFSVTKDSAEVPSEAGVFTASTAGKYDVLAVANNEEYTVSIWAVDKSANPTPNGQITEANEGDFGDIDGVTKTYVNDTFDGSAGTSVKYDISVTTTNPSTYSIPFTPSFPLEYYQTLKVQGYDKVAIRLKYGEDKMLADGYIMPLVNTVAHRDEAFGLDVYLQDGSLYRSYDKTAVAANHHIKAWGDIYYNPGSGYTKPLDKAWMEVVVPIDEFINRYDAESMDLLHLQLAANSGQTVAVTVTIDNVYAVKAMEDDGTMTSTIEKATLNTVYDVYTKLGYAPAKDIDTTVVAEKGTTSITLTADGKATLDKSAIYSFSLSPIKNRYASGTRTQTVATRDITTLVASPDTMSLSNAVAPDGVTKSKDTTKKLAYNQSSIKFGSSPTYGSAHGINFNIAQEKSHYETLQTQGYTHISYYFAFTDYRGGNVGGAKIYADGLNGSQSVVRVVNSSDGTYTGETTALASDSWWAWATHSSTDWCEIRIPIQTWLDNYGDGTSSFMFTPGGSNNQVWTLWFGGARAINVNIETSSDPVVYAPTSGSYTAINENWSNATVTLDDTIIIGENVGSLLVSGGNNTSNQGFSFTAKYDKAHYEALATEYNYVTYYFQYAGIYNGQLTGFKVFANGITEGEVQLIVKDNYDGETVKTAANADIVYDDSWGQDKTRSSTGWCELRIPIQTWLNNFDTMKIVTKANNNPGGLFRFWFGGCELIKVAE